MKKLEIKGVIVGNDDAWIYHLFGMDATCPADVSGILDEASGEDVEITINSGGGSVFAGTEIYTRLRQYTGRVLIRIQSMAASAAAVIAMAGESEISPVAQLMIHNVSAVNQGDNRSMDHMADVLRSANESLASAFVAKTGKTQQEILHMMDEETWMTAQRAVEEGFVDRIMFADGESEPPMQLAASFGPGLLPQSVLDYARTNLRNRKEPTAQEKARAEYDYLKMEERKHEV